MSLVKIDLYLSDPALVPRRLEIVNPNPEERIKGSLLREVIESFQNYGENNHFIKTDVPLIVTYNDKVIALLNAHDGPTINTDTEVSLSGAQKYEANVYSDAIVFH